MEIQVECYDVMETLVGQTAPMDEQSQAIADELGLEGQKKLTNKNGVIRPYNLLTKEQQFICCNLFPTATKISDYDIGPIPYRVMKEAKAAKEHVPHLYVLHEAPAIVKDPILVGTDREFYNWEGQMHDNYARSFLIARWGEALLPWEEMVLKAQKVFMSTAINTMKRIKAEADHAIGMLSDGIMPSNEKFNLKDILKEMPFSE